MNEKTLRSQVEELFDELSRNYCINLCLDKEDDFVRYIIERLHYMLYPQAYEEEDE